MKMIGEEKLLYRSPCPDGVYCYTPWICHGFNGRLMASFDIAGPGLSELPGPKSDHGDYGSNQCRIYKSDDHGENWTHCADLPMLHARVFRAGKALYIIGHSGRLVIAKSIDNGDTWSELSVLDARLNWHQSGGAIDFRHGRIYISMELIPEKPYWSGGDPVLMSADENADLLLRSSWTFSEPAKFDMIAAFKNTTPINFSASCWLESNVVRIYDPENRFFDPFDRTVLLFMRIDGCEHYAAVLAGRETADHHELTLESLKRPDGTPVIFFPFPGGHMKFHIVYDEIGQRYWLAAGHVEYSTACGAPENRERRVLGLYCSANLFDWQLAGIAAAGEKNICSRHYASLAIDGDDIIIISRSGDCAAKNSHDTDMITIHRVKNFRELALKGAEK